MFFLATVDPEGWPTCSYKGGDPGFVRVVDDTTLAFPCYDGNGMYLSMGNVMSGSSGDALPRFRAPEADPRGGHGRCISTIRSGAAGRKRSSSPA